MKNFIKKFVLIFGGLLALASFLASVFWCYYAFGWDGIVLFALIGITQGLIALMKKKW